MDSTWPPSAKTTASGCTSLGHPTNPLRCGRKRGGEGVCPILLMMWEGSQCPLDMQEGEGPEGSRGARLLWLDKERIVISGFNKLSEAVAIGSI